MQIHSCNVQDAKLTRCCLLSSNTAQELDLVTFNLNKITEQKSKTQKINDKNIQNLINKFPVVFNSVGKLKDHTVKLNIDDKVIPIAQPRRRIPFHVRDKVKDAIEKLEKEGIIERVPENQPTLWVSPVVAVPKSDGTITLCMDMRMANQAIQRACHLIPTVEDISLDVNQAKYFTKLDLSQAYHQLLLEEQSRIYYDFQHSSQIISVHSPSIWHQCSCRNCSVYSATTATWH